MLELSTRRHIIDIEPGHFLIIDEFFWDLAYSTEATYHYDMKAFFMFMALGMGALSASGAQHELIGPTVSFVQERGPAAQVTQREHAGIGVRSVYASLLPSGLGSWASNWKAQSMAYLYRDQFGTNAAQVQWGYRTMLYSWNAPVRLDGAVNANIFYKGVNWDKHQSWRVVPSLDLMLTHSSGMGVFLSYYMYPHTTPKTLPSFTFGISYRF